MIIPDTNIVSELLRTAPEPKVEAWLAAQEGAAVYLTTISEAELRLGVEILAKGKRRDALAQAVDGMLREDFRDRILPFDSAAADQPVRLPDRRHRPCPGGDRRHQKRQGF